MNKQQLIKALNEISESMQKAITEAGVEAAKYSSDETSQLNYVIGYYGGSLKQNAKHLDMVARILSNIEEVK